MTEQPRPVTSSMLGDAMAHHLWATTRLIDACEALSAEQLAMHAPGTYGTIIATFGHLVGSDRWYLGFFPDFAGGLEELGEAKGATLAELRTEIGRNAHAWHAILSAGLDPDTDVPELT